MARRARSVARVRLARSLPRLLAAPLVVVAAGGGLAAAGLLLVGGVGGIGMAAGGALLAVAGVIGAAALLSIRVHVEESLVRVSWLFGRRVYLLTRGSLTRIRLRGPEASKLRARFGLGWAMGPAQLRDEEEIHVVRLAPTASAILIPTALGRLAIATSNEPHLIDALTRAAQARAAREELAEAVAADELAQSQAPLLSGIERALYEGRLAQQRIEAAAAAAADAAAQLATVPEPPAQPITAAVEAPGLPAPRGRIFRRPSWARRRPSMPSLPPTWVTSIAIPAAPERVRALRSLRLQPSWLVPLVPLAAAGAAWGLGIYLGRLPEPGTDAARLTALALVLAGPATTVGAFMARTWWPRIVGVVIIGGVVAALFIGRAMLGG